MKKILITTPLPEEVADKYKDEFILDYPEQGKQFSKDELITKIKEAHGYLGGPLTREMIDNAYQLEIASSFGAGFEHLDYIYAGEKGIWVMNAPHATTEPTAELTMTILLCLSRRVPNFINFMRKRGECSGISTFVEPIDSAASPTVTYGKTLGIVGFGKIGKSVSKKAQAFGMNVIYYNTTRESESVEKEYNVRYVSFEELLKTADYVTLHCQYKPENHHLMDTAQFKIMKPTAYFINAGRGKLMNERALIEALKTKEILGAALDVFEFEPEITPELLELENVVLTPHIGTSAYESRVVMATEALDGIAAQLRGGKSPTIVNEKYYKAK